MADQQILKACDNRKAISGSFVAPTQLTVFMIFAAIQTAPYALQRQYQGLRAVDAKNGGSLWLSRPINFVRATVVRISSHWRMNADSDELLAASGVNCELSCCNDHPK